jgi:hypothetical protein
MIAILHMRFQGPAVKYNTVPYITPLVIDLPHIFIKQWWIVWQRCTCMHGNFQLPPSGKLNFLSCTHSTEPHQAVLVLYMSLSHCP